MAPLLTKLSLSALMSAASLLNPTEPKALSFDASAYITANRQVRVAVQKTTAESVIILLRDKKNSVLFRQAVSKHKTVYAVRLDVSELADGEYDLELKSSEGSIHKQLNLSTQPALQVNRAVAIR